MNLRESNLQLETITATVTKTVLNDGAVVFQCTSSSSLVITVTASVQQGGTFTTIPVGNYKTGSVDSDGAAISVASGDILFVNTAGLAELKVTVVSGSGALQMRRWEDPILASATVRIVANTAGGVTPYFAIPAGSGDGDAAVIKGAAGTVYGIQLGNIQSVPVYFKLYDTAATPTSSDTPVKVIEVPANATAALGAGNNVPIPPQGIAFASGISWRIVTGIANNDSTEVSAAKQVINVDYA